MSLYRTRKNHNVFLTSVVTDAIADLGRLPSSSNLFPVITGPPGRRSVNNW